MVYWGLVWCIGGWCGVLGVGAVHWELVWCIGGWCGVLGVGVVYWGLVWCIGDQCGVLDIGGGMMSLGQRGGSVVCMGPVGYARNCGILPTTAA